jgi:hypothetical protein
MAVLTNFPLDYNDQISVIEIFDGLMRQSDDAPNSMEAGSHKPASSLQPDLRFQRGPSDPSQ